MRRKFPGYSPCQKVELRADWPSQVDTLKKSRFTATQIVSILKKAHAGVAVKDICLKHRISDATYYDQEIKIWRHECDRNHYYRLNQWSKVIQTDFTYEFVTNALDIPAQTVADLCKERWQIEIFFQWIKQNLRVKSFLGTTLNAVKTQLRITMCAYLGLSFLKFQSKIGASLQRM